MKQVLLGGVLLAALLPVVSAEARPVECLVVMDGQTAMDGRCEFEAEPGGDFTIRQGTRTASVRVDPGSREGRANYEDTAPSNQQSLVWNVRRDGACWVDRTSRICAWSIGQRPQAQTNNPPSGMAQMAPPAASPPPQQQLPAPQAGGRGRAVSFYNEEDGGLCIVAARPQAQAQVVLGDCSRPGARFIIDAAAQRVRLAANPALCLDAEFGDETTSLFVNLCNDNFEKFTVRGNRLRPDGGACVGVRGALRAGARMENQPCNNRAGQRFVMNDAMEADSPPAPQAHMAPPAYVPPVQQAPRGQRDAQHADFARAGVWQIRRVTDRPGGQRTLGCVADTQDPAFNNVRFAIDNVVGIIEFRDGSNFARTPQRFQVRVTFGSNSRRIFSLPAQIIDEGDGRWARLTADRNLNSGIENADDLMFEMPAGAVIVVPLPDRQRLWPAMARCVALIR